MFDDYIHWRMHFQSVISKSEDKERISSFLRQVQNYNKKLLPIEKRNIEDLIEDIELLLEKLNRPKNKKRTYNKKYHRVVRGEITQIEAQKKELDKVNHDRIISIDLLAENNYQDVKNKIIYHWYLLLGSYEELAKKTGFTKRTLGTWIREHKTRSGL